MDTFNFKNRNFSSSPHLFGLIALAAGLFVCISPLFLSGSSSTEKVILVGTIVTVIGLIILTSYSGTLIDFSEKRVKEYSIFCGFQNGDWQAIPEIRKVKVINANFKSSNTPNGISPTLSGQVTEYKVLLYGSAPTPVTSFIYKREDQALENAKLLAMGLQAELQL